jgi:hypothetical protein
MNPKTIERTSELACNLVMTVLSLALIAGYVCLFHVFRADRQEGRAAAMEQPAAASVDDSLSYREAE